VTLRDHLRDRARRLDASGTAQLFLAGVVYIFAVVEAFGQLGGITLSVLNSHNCVDEITAHGLAIGNAFNWLIPLVWGWFVITTQYGRELRTNRLLENRAAQLYTINAAGNVVPVQPTALLRVRNVAGEVHTDTTALVNGDEQRFISKTASQYLITFPHYLGLFGTISD
jgi:hypothetical protein